MTTALVALQAGRYVVRKAYLYADLYKVYQQEINDEWSEFIEEIYHRCRIEWEYRIPDNRVQLCDLCSRILAFENHFLALYRVYLLQEQSSDDEQSVRQLLWLLAEIPWSDDELTHSVEVTRQRLAL